MGPRNTSTSIQETSPVWGTYTSGSGRSEAMEEEHWAGLSLPARSGGCGHSGVVLDWGKPTHWVYWSRGDSGGALGQV